MKTLLYGASDDLIEIEGAITDEHDCYEVCEKGINFSASDGTKGVITYDGEWKIEVISNGTLFSNKTLSVGDDSTHVDEAKGCTSYSDVVIFESGLEWIKIGKKTYK